MTIIRVKSHRAGDKLKTLLGRKVPYSYTFEDGGIFVKLDDPVEVEKALAIKGISKCRDQNDETYSPCWSMS